jgi:hypothetical protein
MISAIGLLKIGFSNYEMAGALSSLPLFAKNINTGGPFANFANKTIGNYRLCK